MGAEPGTTKRMYEPVAYLNKPLVDSLTVTSFKIDKAF
jgi:hypothetical protein